MLRIRLLGDFAIELDTAPLSAIRSARLQSLLAYLLLHRGIPGSRAHLAFQLWPDSSESQAQANLRYFLHQLRRALPDADRYIQADKTTLMWRKDAPYTLDVAEFERAMLQADGTEPEAALKQALDLYQGELLPGCYDDWIVPERERLRALSLQALERLGGLYEQRGSYAAAIQCTQHLLRQDPLREATYRHLMHLHACNGDRAGTLRVYHTCASVLRRELDVEPSQSTRETYERLTQTQTPSNHHAVIDARSAPRLDLPLQSTSFIGRERELVELRSLLPRTRLLTLTGAGGSGKTRLALALAAGLAAAQAYADGVAWVELAAVVEPSLVPQVVATALSLREQPGQTLGDTLANHLCARHFLLVLDSAEHVVEACANLTGMLLRVCPKLTILVTSRSALAISGETTWLIPPLSLLPEWSGPVLSPTNGRPSDLTPQAVMQSEAVRLFIERAQTALPTFRLTDKNAAAVARVCQRLDGIPLAIELAAARIKLLTVEQIAVRLDDALRLLRGSSRSMPERHQTLRAAIDWSHNLLLEEERTFFRRLAVFAGSFSLAEAETVCSSQGSVASSQTTDDPVWARRDGGRWTAADDRRKTTGNDPTTNDHLATDYWLLASEDILDLLSRLIDQSLVVVLDHEQASEARYRLLDTIRQYGQEKLLESGESATVRQQHAAYFMRLAEQTAQEFKGRDQAAWIERLEQANENLRAALEWSVESRSIALGLRLASAIWRFWFARGYLSEGREWLARLLSLAGQPSLTIEYAAANYGAGVIAWRQGDHAAARKLGEQSLAVYHALEDGEGIGLSLIALANVTGAQGDYVAQRAHLEESLALFRELGDKSGAAGALNNLGELVRFQGTHAEAEPYYVESLTFYREVGNVNGTALVLHNLGHVLMHAGDHRRAAKLFRDSLVQYQGLGHRSGIAMCLAAVAGFAAGQGTYAHAAQLFAAAESLRDTIGVTMDGADQVAHDRYLALARRQLDEQTFSSAWAEGQAMTMDQAVGAALAALEPAAAGALP